MPRFLPYVRTVFNVCICRSIRESLLFIDADTVCLFSGYVLFMTVGNGAEAPGRQDFSCVISQTRHSGGPPSPPFSNMKAFFAILAGLAPLVAAHCELLLLMFPDVSMERLTL